MASEIVSNNDDESIIIIFRLNIAPPSVIGMGNDQSNLSIGKDNLDHVMSPFQRTLLLIIP